MSQNSSAVRTVAMPCNVFSYAMKPWALEMGGRYQKDHASFSEWALAAGEEAEVLFSAIDAMLETLAIDLFPSLGTVVLGTADPMAVSNGFPPDLGVLADPNDAKAPEPKPKALEAPLVGDARPPPDALKGLALPCAEVSPPWRLEKGPLREESFADEPFGPGDDVVSDSLPELRADRKTTVISLCNAHSDRYKAAVWGGGFVARSKVWKVVFGTYFVRRVQRLLLSVAMKTLFKRRVEKSGSVSVDTPKQTCEGQSKRKGEVGRGTFKGGRRRRLQGSDVSTMLLVC